MVLDFRHGRSWTAAVISKVLGPVTYLVDTVDGYKWKRHTDQIKSLQKSLIALDQTQTEEFFPDVTVTTTPDPGSEETSEEDSSGDTPADHTDEDEPARRYPTRDRRPPDRYE